MSTNVGGEGDAGRGASQSPTHLVCGGEQSLCGMLLAGERARTCARVRAWWPTSSAVVRLRVLFTVVSWFVVGDRVHATPARAKQNCAGQNACAALQCGAPQLEFARGRVWVALPVVLPRARGAQESWMPTACLHVMIMTETPSHELHFCHHT